MGKTDYRISIAISRLLILSGYILLIFGLFLIFNKPSILDTSNNLIKSSEALLQGNIALYNNIEAGIEFDKSIRVYKIILTIISGLLLIVFGQAARAVMDNANYSKQILNKIIDKNN